jgi:hypothetical protein
MKVRRDAFVRTAAIGLLGIGTIISAISAQAAVSFFKAIPPQSMCEQYACKEPGGCPSDLGCACGPAGTGPCGILTGPESAVGR